MDLRGKRILVTGGAGFLGSHLLERLKQFEPAALFVPRSAKYDLVEKSAVEQLYSESRPDLVFHLAARVGGIGANQQNPGRYFYENLAMGVNIIEQGRRFAVPKIVLAGTICSYPKFTPTPFREDDLWNGYPEETNAPYGIAKKAQIVMAQAYRQQYGCNVVVALPVNLYGPRDNFDLETSHVIPAIIRKCVEALDSERDEVALWGDGSPTREFLFVDDCAAGLIRVAESYDSSDPLNLGSGQEISILDLAKKIAMASGFRGRFIWEANRPNGQPRRVLDVTRAKERLGFVARTNLDSGLQATIDWFKQHRENLR